MKNAIMWTVLLALVCPTASSQVFKKHKIGETAEQFFSIAMMGENKTLTAKYCKGYLSDPKASKAYDKAKISRDAKAQLQAMETNGCRAVQAALEGKDAKVFARYADELGQGGSATFHNSRLVMLILIWPSFAKLNLTAPAFEDVVTDLRNELGGAEPTRSVDTKQNAYGATLQELRATWDVNNVYVQAGEMRNFEFSGIGVQVVIADSEYLKQVEAERQATRPNTIR